MIQVVKRAEEKIEVNNGYYKFDKNKPVKLDIGSGINYYKGENDNEIEEWTHLDCDPAPHVEIVCRIENGIPIEDGVVDKLHSSEFIEHLPKWMEEPIMKEINRVMKIGAEFIGTTPSLKYSMEEYLAGRMTYREVMSNYYGDQFGTVENPGYQHCHYRLFDRQSLIEFLEKWGFGEIDLSRSPGNPLTSWWFVFSCKKIRNV